MIRYSGGLWGAIALVGALGSAGCSGMLVIPDESGCKSSSECGFDKICIAAECVTSPGPCSQEFPEGDCAPGMVCQDGECGCSAGDPLCPCYPDVAQCNWCAPGECTETQTCVAGSCEDYEPGANSCSPERPNGLCQDGGACCEGGTVCCADGEICVGTHCVPNTHPCSQQEPNGWCGQGLSCFRGDCISLAACDCTPGSTKLPCCPDGQACEDNACQGLSCGGGVWGVCERDFVCDDNGCDQLDCNPDHTGGECDDPLVCKSTGECRPEEWCAEHADCRDGVEYCSTVQECEILGQCNSDDDCALGQPDSYGQGYRCELTGLTECVVRVAGCDTDEECLPGFYCTSATNCRLYPECDADVDCDLGFICGESGVCLSEFVDCKETADCRARDGVNDPLQQRCNINREKCYEVGICTSNAQCAPAQYCEIPTGASEGECAPYPTDCSTNEPSYTCGLGEIECCVGCCGPGSHCALPAGEDEGWCIPEGRCHRDADCPSGFVCDAGYYCVPTQPCSKDVPCDAGERCSTYVSSSGVVTGCIATTTCALYTDCGAGEYCGGTFQCQPDEVNSCGEPLFLDVEQALPPNVLIVLDRSGSMNFCGPAVASHGPCGWNDKSGCDAACDDIGDPLWCMDLAGTLDDGCYDPACTSGCADPPACTDTSVTTRWVTAVKAIEFVTGAYDGRISFGLSTYPAHPADRSTYYCGNSLHEPLDCNYWYCSATESNAGAVDVAIAESSAQDIVDTLVPYHCSQTLSQRCFANADCPGGERCVPAGVCSTSGTDCSLDADCPGAESCIGAAVGIVPGGATPTAPTFRTILADENLAGLDSPDRANAVLLITDGEANEDYEVIKTCAPACVTNGSKDGDETAIDCGGPCGPCAAGSLCSIADDCQTGICRGGECRAQSCVNGEKDTGEIDVDCGGGCGVCPDGNLCSDNLDCKSLLCVSGICAAPSCFDQAKNGSETGADCGGECATRCADGQACGDGSDCASGVCQEHICRPATCADGAKVAPELGVDCGGDCGRCADGAACPVPGVNADCESGMCIGGFCAKPVCANGVHDVGETDVDCGGTCTEDCGGGRVCGGAGDCASGTCLDCGSLPDDQKYACKVNAAIAQMYNKEPHIKTFVVGFNMVGGISKNLNCNTVYGRTARRSQGDCASRSWETCDEPSTAACYYDASDETSLRTAFTDILEQVTSCSFGFTPPARWVPSVVTAYVQLPGADPGPPVRVPRDTGWVLDDVNHRVEFLGTYCTKIKAGQLKPVVAFPCGTGGG